MIAGPENESLQAIRPHSSRQGIAPGTLARLATPDRSVFSRHRGWILGPAIVVMLFLGLYAMLLRPVYRAEAILMQTAPPPAAQDEPFRTLPETGKDDIAALAKAPVVLRAVAQQSGLAERLAQPNVSIKPVALPAIEGPAFIRQAAEFVADAGLTLEALLQSVRRFMDNDAETGAADAAPLPAAAAYLSDAIEIAEKGNRVAVRIDEYDPEWAALLANQLADTIIQADVQLKYDALESGKDWTANRRESLAQQAKEAEVKFNELQEDAARLQAAANAPDAFTAAAEELKKVQAEQQRLMSLQDDINAVLQAPDMVGVTALAGRLNRIDITRAVQRDSRLREQETALQTTTAADAPERTALDDQKAISSAALRAALENAVQDIGEELGVLDVEVSQKRRALARQQDLLQRQQGNGGEGSLAEKIQAAADRLAKAEAELAAFDERYGKPGTGESEIAVARDKLAPSYALLQAAAVPEEPRQPHPLLWMVAGFLVTAWLMYLYVLFRLRMHRGIESGRQLQALAGIEVIGLAPAIRGADRPDREPYKLIRDRPNSAYTESIQCLLASLALRPVEDPSGAVPVRGIKSVLVTSAEANEGKTTLALSLAAAAAASHRRVLLIDSDSRIPAIHQRLGLPLAPGLLELLRGDVRMRDCVRTDRTTGMQVLSAGQYQDDSGRAFFNERFQLLLNKLTADYDLVVIDGPPIGGIADATLLSGLADIAVLAVRWRHTSRAAAVAAAQQVVPVARDAVAVMTVVDTEKYVKSGFGEAALFLSARKNYYVG